MGKCSQLNNCLLQITASVIEANGVMHSADGETRELAVASLERLVADLQKVKNTPRLVDCFSSTAGLCLILCSLGFAAWHVAAGSRGRNCSSFIRKVKSANIRQSENIDTHCEDLL